MTGKSNNVLIGCLLALLVLRVRQSVALGMSWSGLGEDACFGQTCLAGQFCSDSPLFQRCRDCEDIKVWCSSDPGHLAKAFPSCLHVCPAGQGQDLKVRPSSPDDQKDYPEGTAGWHQPLTAVVSVALLAILVVVLVYFGRRRYKRAASQQQEAKNDVEKQDEDTAGTCLLPSEPSAPPSDSELHVPKCDATTALLHNEQELPQAQVTCSHSHALATAGMLGLSVPVQDISVPAEPSGGTHSRQSHQIIGRGPSAQVNRPSPGSADRDVVGANVRPDCTARDSEGIGDYVTVSSEHVTMPQLLPLCHPQDEPQFVISHLHV